MGILAMILVIFVAVLHVGFLYLEMFLWKTPNGQKIFKIDAKFAEESAVLAANQGLYNGFLAAGLLWSLALNPREAFHTQIFFLSCVLVAGLYGAYSTKKRNILFLQAIPAALALVVVIFSFS